MNPRGSPLSPDDLLTLEKCGITHEVAEQAMLRRVVSVEGAEIVDRRGRGDFAGIIFPCVWPGEQHVRAYRLRRDRPDFEQRPDGTQKEQGKYLSAPGGANLLYFTPGTDPAWLADPSLPILMTEGEKKCLALTGLARHDLGNATTRPRWLAAALPGVWNWRGTIGKTPGPNGDSRAVKGVIPDFNRILWQARRVVIVFDADLDANESVQFARKGLTRELQERGASVAWFAWPKDLPPETKGIDDFLAARGPEETLKLIASARVKRQRRNSALTVEVPGTEGPRPLTELGNAERLVATHGEMFRYCGPRRTFLIHDGKRWIDDEAGQMERWAKATVRDIYREAADLDDATLRGATADWAKRSEKAAQIAAMLRLAASESGVPALPCQFDADPWSLNVANGTIDLRTGALRPHRREDLITRIAPVEYDPSAKCPRWRRFLSEVFEPHPDVISFMQLAAGYSLTADTREECLFLLHGVGRNGKGTLLKILTTIMGEYSGTSDFSTFVATRDDRGPRDDIANMKGRRLVSAQEAREGASLAESIVKWLTGGDRVRARKLHENSYEFDPTWKIWLATNHKPTIKGQDPGIWSRIRLVPFDVSFEGREDRTLKAALVDELPGVLAWAVDGCLRWQAEGLPVPDSVVKATAQYRSESNQVARFIQDYCVLQKGVSVQASKLYLAYKQWTQRAKERERISDTAFGRRLVELGFEKEHKSCGTVYRDIGVPVINDGFDEK